MYARVLHVSDLPAVEAFLVRHSDSSMILRGNLLRDGIEDGEGRFSGVYAGAFDAGGELRAVVAHYRRLGNVFPQAECEAALDAALACAVEHSGQPVRGLIGPQAIVRRARAQLGLDAAPARYDTDEGLYALALAQLRVPALLSRPDVALRALRPSDAEVYVRWCRAYESESLGVKEGPELEADCRRQFERALQSDEPCLLTHAGLPCAKTGFNARLPDRVQIGGVYTPTQLRGRGYARAAVAASLLHARAAGATRAILFTGNDNLPAIAAYRALGFERIGDFALILFS